MKSFKQRSPVRSFIVIGVAVLVFAVYLFQLLQIQVVDAQKYQDMVQGFTMTTQPIKAVRGEVVDRNGVPLIQNQMSYDVIIDKAFLPAGEENEIISRLISHFEKTHTPWIDNLPITLKTPFSFLPDREKDVEAVRKEKAQPYTTAEDIMHWLIEEYKLQDYSLEEARRIAGVRYEMERKDFSIRLPYTFATDISNALVIQIKERSYELPGVNVVASATRVYPHDDIAPHMLGQTGPLYQEEYEKLKEEGKIFKDGEEPYDTIGYTMDDIIGKSGIEKAMESELRGHNGLTEIQLNAQGQVVDVVESISPIPGNTIVLTIDEEMQRNAQEYLEAQIRHLAQTQPPGRGAEAHSGAVVVLRPKTGEVLAAATYPSYTMSEYRTNYTEVMNREGSPLINRAILGEYTPGSIFKPLVALAGLNNGVITPTSTFYCGHVYTYFAPTYTPKCLGSHGNIGVHNALGWSCNIFFYETGRLLGIQAIDDMAVELGLGDYTGIEIEEGKGQRSNPAVKEAIGNGEWYEADTIQTAIGQFDSRYTPLQLANYVATIGNRGTRMKCTLVREVQDYTTGEVIIPFEPKVAHEMTGVSQEAFETTIRGMINATTGSAGGTFNGYPIVVASKTGTPQVSEDVVNSTFITFAPAEDPELAICVVIEEGWQGYTGAPVAKAIFDDYFEVDHRGGVASGPQRLKDYRIATDNPNATAKELFEGVDPDKTPVVPKQNPELLLPQTDLPEPEESTWVETTNPPRENTILDEPEPTTQRSPYSGVAPIPPSSEESVAPPLETTG